jgi:hypothetical protein
MLRRRPQFGNCFFPADNGEADKAKAMLPKTVTALKADKTKTLDLFNKAEAPSSTAVGL